MTTAVKAHVPAQTADGHHSRTMRFADRPGAGYAPPGAKPNGCGLGRRSQRARIFMAWIGRFAVASEPGVPQRPLRHWGLAKTPGALPDRRVSSRHMSSFPAPASMLI